MAAGFQEVAASDKSLQQFILETKATHETFQEFAANQVFLELIDLQEGKKIVSGHVDTKLEELVGKGCLAYLRMNQGSKY